MSKMSAELELKTESTSQKHGLLTRTGTQVPLKEIHVDIKIIGFVAEVKSSLLYFNDDENPVEAQFTFPVDDGSAVFRFETEIEGRHIVAEIQEKEQAKLTYEDAMKKGKTAMLLKEDDTVGDIFHCTLGNLPPRTDAKITFSYVIELPQEPDGKIRFTLPTVLNPRYSSSAGGTVAAEGATYSNPARIPYKFSMTANVRGYHKILSVTSVYEKLKMEIKDDESAEIFLLEKFKFDHDLSFLVGYEKCHEPQVVLETGNPEGAGIMKEDLLMLNFYPNLQETTTQTNGEYIFVVDRSGSMRGKRMDNTKEALFLLLKSLPANCYFNVISFGSDYSSLFKLGSCKYNKSNLKHAMTLLEKMEADMGGTEIYKPFKHIFSRNIIKGHPRQIILLTDGEVYDTHKLIGLVKTNGHNSRVFTLGIGSGVSTSLIEGVARAGNGKAEIIADKGRLQAKVIYMLKCATQPAVSNIELKWELPKMITAVLIPNRPVPYLNIGHRVCLYALLTGETVSSSSQQCNVILKGECDGDPIEYKMPFSLTPEMRTAKHSSPLHRLAAKAQIKILEIEEAEVLAREVFSRTGNEDLMEVRQNMTLMSTTSNIISKMTAFVAIDKDAKRKVEGDLVQRYCPIPVATPQFGDALHTSMTSGCGLYDASQAPTNDGVSAMMTNLKCMAIDMGDEIMLQNRQLDRINAKSSVSTDRVTAANQRALNLLRDLPEPGVFSKMKKRVSNLKRRSTDMRDGEDDENGGRCHQGDQMFEMIGLQDIQGYWTLSKEVARLLGVQVEMIKSAKINKDTNVVTTLAVIVWLRSKFSERHDEWELIENKAFAWLRPKLSEQTTLDGSLELVKQTLWINGL